LVRYLQSCSLYVYKSPDLRGVCSVLPASAAMDSKAARSPTDLTVTTYCRKETIMHSAKIAVLAVSLLAMAGNAGAFDLSSICCDGGYEYRPQSSWEIEQQRLRDALAAAQKENGVLSSRSGDLE